MATPLRKRKREIQDVEVMETRFCMETPFKTKLSKRRRKTMHPPLQTELLDKENLRLGAESQGHDFTPWKPPSGLNKPDFTPQPLKRNATLRGTLRRRVSMSVMKKKMRKFQDYSLMDSNFQYLDSLGRGDNQICRTTSTTDFKDTDLQQKIDHEVKMREGTAKLLAATKHPAQMLEAARNLLTSNTRIIAYMTELQKRKTAEVLGKNMSMDGNQVPCKSSLCVSDIRIPLMWKDTDHFKNKGDYRRFAVFCLVRIGTDLYDTSLISNVDRSMTDLSFDDVISLAQSKNRDVNFESLHDNVPHNFECKLEVYCHKLHEDLTIASTPKKLRKKINDISGSVGRSVGKRLSGLNDADIIGNMVLGPRFELVAEGTMELKDVDDSVRTFDLQLVSTNQAAESGCEIPLFGHYCCRLAAQPDCLVSPEVTGYLNIQEDDDLAKWRRYWCMLKNLQLSCWLSPSDTEVTDPQVTVPVTKNTQISDADPRTSERSHTFHIKTVQRRGTFQHTLAADSAEDLSKWWDGLQQHLLDQAFWKHACEHVMPLKKASPRKKPAFLRKGSLYEDTPIEETAPAKSTHVIRDLGMEDDQLSKMLHTLMGEAKQIRGDDSRKSSSASVS